MTLRKRVRAAERTADRYRDSEPRSGVCDRIEELAVLFAEHPPAFTPEVVAGITAAVERQIRADEQFRTAPVEDQP